MSDLLLQPLGNHCPSCHEHYATAQGVSAHLSHRPECRRAFKSANAANRAEAATQGLISKQSVDLEDDRRRGSVPEEASQHHPENPDHFAPDAPLPDPPRRNYDPPPIATEAGDSQPSQGKRRRVEVEEVPDEEEGGLPRKPWIEDFPGHAGTTFGTAETPFEGIRRQKGQA